MGPPSLTFAWIRSPTSVIGEAVERRTIALEPRTLGLKLLQGPLSPPVVGEIVARVTMAGVCGTDAHRLAGDVAPGAYAYAFGHEPVGVVHALGEGRVVDSAGSPLAVGDRIVWYPASAGCGECAACLRGEHRVCLVETWPPSALEPNSAGYQDYATLSRRVEVYRLPDAVPDEAFVALGCALPTALAGADRLGPISPEHTVVVQGSGPVGLASAALAAMSGPRQLIVIGTPRDRLSWADRLGATTTIDLDATTPRERRNRVMELTEGAGADVVIEAAGVAEAFVEGLELLARAGRYLVTGLFSGARQVSINPVIINNRALRIIGNLGATPAQRRRAVELAASLHSRHRIGDLVTLREPLTRTADAIRRLGLGEVTKAVVIP